MEECECGCVCVSVSYPPVLSDTFVSFSSSPPEEFTSIVSVSGNTKRMYSTIALHHSCILIMSPVEGDTRAGEDGEDGEEEEEEEDEEDEEDEEARGTNPIPLLFAKIENILRSFPSVFFSLDRIGVSTLLGMIAIVLSSSTKKNQSITEARL